MSVAAPVRKRRLQTWFAAQDPRELLLWTALLVAGVIVRVIAVGDRPFHHDESQDAYFSYLFRQNGDYKYNPLLHGPLRFYLTGLMYVVFGDTDFTARLAPLLMGAAMIPLCWGLRPLLGRGAAFAAAALLAFGPSYLYFSRFAREDIYVASLTLALIVVIWRFLDTPRKYHPAMIGALVALSFATKETTFITVFVMGSFFLIALLIPPWKDQVWGPVRAAGLEGWGWALAALAGVYAILFTTFLTHPEGIRRHLRRARLLARPARGRPRRRARGLLHRAALPRRVAGAHPRGDRRRRAVAQVPPVRGVPPVGLLPLARRLLVGGREVRLARAAPAAAARAAGRRRPAGDLGGARRVAGRRARRSPPSRCSTSASRRIG